MSQSTLAEPALEEEVLATHESLGVESPGHEEQDVKDQDRRRLTQVTDQDGSPCLYAIVCDGTTTSPYAADAASYVADQGADLFQVDGLRKTTAYLEAQRAALQQKPLKLEGDHSAALRSMFEEIVREKYRSAYQTTLVAARLRPGAAGEILLKVIGCGDSAFFVFDDDGERLDNNVGVVSANDEIQHGSPFTAVLPDSYNEETDYVLFDRSCPANVNVLLCSDGFYDSFTNFKEMHDWLKENREELRASGADHNCLADLHARLIQRKGDDDISFIWLYPRRQPAVHSATEEAEDETDEDSQPAKADSRRSFVRFFQAILRFLRLSAG